MKIELIDEMIEMEPGPNLYLMGNPTELRLLQDLIGELCLSTGVEFLLNKVIPNIKVVNPNLRIVLKSRENGYVLCKIGENELTIELDPAIWKRVFDRVSSITKKPSHIYLEFDDLNLEQDCNIILSSEW